MNRDTVKTLAGLVIIGVIVVATFLYGNAQRQNQLKHDANVKQQQANANAAGGKALPSGNVAPAASGTAAPSPAKAATNTAPVQSPASSSIQGGGTASSASTAPETAKTPGPAPAGGQVAGASKVPQAGGSAPLPQTGPAQELAGVIGLAAIASMWLWLRRSKRAIFMAARNNR